MHIKASKLHHSYASPSKQRVLLLLITCVPYDYDGRPEPGQQCVLVMLQTHHQGAAHPSLVDMVTMGYPQPIWPPLPNGHIPNSDLRQPLCLCIMSLIGDHGDLSAKGDLLNGQQRNNFYHSLHGQW